jgi:hypothetical protein
MGVVAMFPSRSRIMPSYRLLPSLKIFNSRVIITHFRQKANAFSPIWLGITPQGCQSVARGFIPRALLRGAPAFVPMRRDFGVASKAPRYIA